MPILSNSRHELFAQARAQGQSASAAFVSAGYAANDSNASRLNGNENVKARVEEILAEGARQAGVTVEAIIRELAKIGFSDIRKAVKWGEGLSVPDAQGNIHIVNGVSLIASDEIDDATAAALSEVSQTKEGLKIKFHDKLSALDKLGKHLGMFKEQVEHSGSIKAEVRPVLTNLSQDQRDQLRDIASALVGKSGEAS